MRLHVDPCRLAGTDDSLVRVEIDRAVERVGGVWITWRHRRGDTTADPEWEVWDEHREVWVLSDEQRAEMLAAARGEG